MRIIQFNGYTPTAEQSFWLKRLESALNKLDLFSRVQDGKSLKQEICVYYYTPYGEIDFVVKTEPTNREDFLLDGSEPLNKDLFENGNLSPKFCEKLAQRLIKNRATFSGQISESQS